ncbi:MAG: ATP-binding cassette domain-containing protein [Erysipelotrichia bacterium]|nr:ATP-binding cassette domain-containing protein [Erysipelotrichia bacterium]NCC54712.1 ATP-binding cassette domain-containing protein [Erysipelotrichia bacterium]
MVVSMIEIKALSKSFSLDKNNVVKAIDGINLSIEKGENVAIIGKSGSGKSTLMNMITCIESIEEGEYYFNGEDIRKKNRRQLADFRNAYFGFIYQSFHLLSNLSAYENIELPLIYKGIKKEERKKRIMEISKRVQISDRLNHKPNEMSGEKSNV